MQRISKQSVARVLGSPPTFISLANTTLHLTCMGEQELRTLYIIQHQVTCFKLSLDLIQTPQASYRTILIPQSQTLLIPPPLVWRSRVAHVTNPFNPILMKILIWNYREARNPYFCRSFVDLVRSHRPAITVIMETCISNQRAKDISSSLGFDNVCRFDVVGLRGGIWVL